MVYKGIDSIPAVPVIMKSPADKCLETLTPQFDACCRWIPTQAIRRFSFLGISLETLPYSLCGKPKSCICVNDIR